MVKKKLKLKPRQSIIEIREEVKNKRGKVIGEVYKDGDGPYSWGYYSYRMEDKSGGLTGHEGMETKEEAIEELFRTHKEYGGK